MGTTDTTINIQLELLVAKRDYHKAETEHYEAQISLEEAQAGLFGNQSREVASLMHGQQAYIADFKDEVLRAKLVVTKALAKVDHLIMTLQRQRAAANRVISTSLFAPGAGLVQIVGITEEQLARDTAEFEELTRGIDVPFVGLQRQNKPTVTPDQPAG